MREIPMRLCCSYFSTVSYRRTKHKSSEILFFRVNSNSLELWKLSIRRDKIIVKQKMENACHFIFFQPQENGKNHNKRPTLFNGTSSTVLGRSEILKMRRSPHDQLIFDCVDLFSMSCDVFKCRGNIYRGMRSFLLRGKTHENSFIPSSVDGVEIGSIFIRVRMKWGKGSGDKNNKKTKKKYFEFFSIKSRVAPKNATHWTHNETVNDHQSYVEKFDSKSNVSCRQNVWKKERNKIAKTKKKRKYYCCLQQHIDGYLFVM